jgi:MSHA biogenesis protein MshM
VPPRVEAHTPETLEATDPVKRPMESYLKFFELDQSPFDAEGKSGVVLGTEALRKAFREIRQGLEEGAPRICVSGNQGLGKTSLFRALPKLLSESAQLVQIMNPDRPWQEILTIIARKLDLRSESLSRRKLLAARGDHPYLVIAFDQAELLSRDTLDQLDGLMRFLDDDDCQLVHCVLFANLESAPNGADIPLLWWLDQLSTLQLRFAPIPASGIQDYIEKRLAKAGWAGGDLFSPEACLAIHRSTGGVPSAVNQVCERALAEASSLGLAIIGAKLVEEMCDETAATTLPPLDDRAFFEDVPASASGGLDGGSELSAQSLLDATPIVESFQFSSPAAEPLPGAEAPAQRPEPRPPPTPRHVRASLGSTRGLSDPPEEKAASSSLELSEDPYVTPSLTAPRSTLELADGANPGRSHTPASAAGTRVRRAPDGRSPKKPTGRSPRRHVLLLLLATLLGATFPQLRDRAELVLRLIPDPAAIEADLRARLAHAPAIQRPRPSEPAAPLNKAGAKPGSLAAMLDAIDEAPTASRKEVPLLPVAEETALLPAPEEEARVNAEPQPVPREEPATPERVAPPQVETATGLNEHLALPETATGPNEHLAVPETAPASPSP